VDSPASFRYSGSSMDPRKRAITELNRRIAEAAVEVTGQLERLGEYLAGQDEKAFSDAEFLEARNRVQELRSRLPAGRKQVRRIMQCVEKNAELEVKLREASERFAELERESESICEEIGRYGYAAFRSQSLPLEPLLGVFSKVGRQEQELQGLVEDQERSRGSMRSGNILRFIGEAGRGFFIRSAVGFKRKAVARAYAEAGRALAESELPEQIGDAALKLKVAPYSENRQRLEAITREAEELRAAQSALWEEMKELGVEKSHQKRVREIEREIRQTEDELVLSCRRLGELYRAKPVRSFATDPEVKNRLRRASQAEKRADKHRRRIERIEAAIAIDALDEEVRGMRDKIEKLTREIRAREHEVRGLEKRIGASDTERERLVKARGPEQGLLELDGPENESE
jgi:hypothetical protein